MGANSIDSRRILEIPYANLYAETAREESLAIKRTDKEDETELLA